MTQKLIDLLEEQVAVGFTGKINVLRRANKQFYGQLLLRDGIIVQASFGKRRGVKAFHQLVIDDEVSSASPEKFEFVIEPEVITDDEIELRLIFSDLKNELPKLLESYQNALRLRPPENIRLLIDPEFIEDSLPATMDEFEVLKTLTEWSSVKDLYEYCPLLEHEITLALVSLRRKEGLKTLGIK